MSREIISSIDAIYDELKKRHMEGDPNVTKTKDGHYQLLNEDGKVILESYRF